LVFLESAISTEKKGPRHVPSAARSQVGTALVFDAEGLIGYYRMPLPEVTPGFRGMCTALKRLRQREALGGSRALPSGRFLRGVRCRCCRVLFAGELGLVSSSPCWQQWRCRCRKGNRSAVVRAKRAPHPIICSGRVRGSWRLVASARVPGQSLGVAPTWAAGASAKSLDRLGQCGPGLPARHPWAAHS
jgi:hypothetical protein